MQPADRLQGIEKLSATERLYYEVFLDVIDHGHISDFLSDVLVDLLRRGHIEDYDGRWKLTDSGFQLVNFLQYKMTGKKKQTEPLEREA